MNVLSQVREWLSQKAVLATSDHFVCLFQVEYRFIRHWYTKMFLQSVGLGISFNQTRETWILTVHTKANFISL